MQSIKCIRAGINHWTKEHENIEIIADVRFSKANEMFKAVTTKLKLVGKGFTKSKETIKPNDMKEISAYFNHNYMNAVNQRRLPKAVIFHIIYYFCHRGCENLHAMSHHQFEVGTEPDCVPSY